MTRVPESAEVSTPPQLKMVCQGAELIPPPARHLFTTEPEHIDVERLAGQVLRPKRLRAAISDQLGLS